MEWLEADARLEAKRKSVLRRQQRELRKRQKAVEAHERELQKLAARCREMEVEDQLSVAMDARYREEEERARLEHQRQEEMKLYESITKSRKRSRALGLSLSTPGVSGLQRLQLLQARIQEKEHTLEKAREAKQRLDALPKQRGMLRELMRGYFSSTLRKKVENSVYQQHWDRLVPLFEPATASSGNRSAGLLDHESENGFTPVLVAIFKKKLSVLRKLLELGASPDVETRAGITPLLAVVMTGDVVALSILVEFKVNLDYETKNHVKAVLLAADKGREEVLRALLEHGAQVDGVNTLGRSSLMQTVTSGHFGLLRILLAYGASKELRDREGKAALDWATQLHYPAMISTLNSSTSSANLLAQLKAEDQEEEEHLETVLSANRIAQRRRTAQLERAMRDEDLPRMRELLSAENAQLSPNYEDANGNTPLLVCCRKGICPDVAYFLKRKCIPTHQNCEGLSALMVACKRGDTALIDLLLQSGCSLLTRDFSGHDAYYYLNSYDHPDLAIGFTKAYRTGSNEATSAWVLGTPLASVPAVASAYSISVTQAEISVGLDGESPRKSDSVDADEEAQERNLSDGDDQGGGDQGDEPLANPAIRQWSTRQQILKRARPRKQLYETERERILAARTRGRRNGLIAPLPNDPAGRLKFPTCDNCQSSRARKRCFACEQVLCDKCHARLHELPQRRHHQYEELEPELFVGHQLKEIAQSNQENSLQYAVAQSRKCVEIMRGVLLGEDRVLPPSPSPRSIDPEVDKFQRKKRAAKEKQIMQMQINVPVAAAKHAAVAGEDTMFSSPAELELAALYTTQKKYDKAKELLLQTQSLVGNSMGILHPTMLKIAIGLGRIEQETDHAEKCVETVQDAVTLFEGTLSPDHKDMLGAIALVLFSLDSQARYREAVQVCQHTRDLRTRAFSTTHKYVLEIQERLEEFIAKRETAEMTSEDFVLLARQTEEAKRMQELARESESHLARFRMLLLEDPDGLADFMAFARLEFAEDLVGFWIAIEEYKKYHNQDGCDSKTLRALAVSAFLTYVKSRRVKVITAAQRKKIKKIITTPGKKLPPTLYDDVQQVVFDLVYRGVYARYLVATEWNRSPSRRQLARKGSNAAVQAEPGSAQE